MSPTNPPAHVATELNLKQVATRLGVHYMTAYRYVRQGHLSATRVGTEWRVSEEAVIAFGSRDVLVPEADPTTESGVNWVERLVEPLLNGDEPAAWSVIERALASGRDPTYCYLDMIADSIATIDWQRSTGEVDAAQQPLATAVAYRLVARLGTRFRRPGRSRGSVIFGSPLGEHHQLAIAIVADLVRLGGYDVLELGADLPADAFAAAIGHAPRLVAVGISITRIDHIDSARETIAAVRHARPDVPIIVGGQAVLNPEIAELLDADAWAPDGRAAVAILHGLARRQRR